LSIDNNKDDPFLKVYPEGAMEEVSCEMAELMQCNEPANCVQAYI
jgi:hypothetical protein